MRRPPLLTTSVLLLGVNCVQEEDLPPIVAETEHLQIGLSDSHEGRLCAGDLETYEAHLMKAADALGVEIGGQVEMYLFRYDDLPCPGASSIGCYYEDEDRAFVTDLSWDHELAHAAHARVARKEHTDPFLFEGVAGALEADAVEFTSLMTLPSENLGNPANRDVGAHFVRWIRAAYGDSAFRAVVAEGNAKDLLEGTLEQPLSEIDGEWVNTSPWVLKGINPCPNERLDPVDADQWSFDGEINCDDSQVQSRGDLAMGRCWNVEVENPGTYVLDLPEGNEGALISQCVLEDIPVEADVSNLLDVPLEFENPQSVSFGPGAHPLDLPAATYRLCVGVSGLDPTAVSVSLRPE